MSVKKGTVPTPENGTPHETTNAAIVAQPGAIAKRFHTLRAELALAGFECRDLADLEAFEMGVRK